MMEGGGRDVGVRRAEARVWVLDLPRERERRHDRRALADAGGPLRLLQGLDGLSGELGFARVVLQLADLRERQARGVAFRVGADGAVPAVVMPRNADREVAKREVRHAAHWRPATALDARRRPGVRSGRAISATWADSRSIQASVRPRRVTNR